ncbi:MULTISPECIES: heme lyase CcmF/NrfE family subunit [Pseudomonadota]|jgi:cytochrome c-type biogenesis protein CcmF|uniref:Heme lyase CcmF/NrfE family subunit n=4 Tax=Pseudomonadota TaxID=1224 RepID=A0A9X3R4V7_ALCXX|nr:MULTISPECIES: heme lyase CcmF/NrfE family subunit [Pseudomonadota]MBH1366726.1 heme lyase CcmF/NrfE family subunit [Stenotrophomonas maltophilia]MBG0862532.1 heme lyase CcmF/NrfE family subunit [Burkholderia sp. 9779_493]MBH1434247.1 heme lyase CcmF/NrfE family subunit [Stenotrophomonas maltophilia]MBH1732375.1 heme lyase CcmF/NrfE family subunit [Stenotrophomonas maltophilia]MBH1767924.1 heme lyase CcmF/NrfE family subunit [Stenotrophomonas maltophilia]
MIPEIGHLALIAALFVALAQGVLALAGAARANLTWIAFARPAARTQFLLVIVGFTALTWAFVAKDYSVAYVAQNSNSQLPLGYRMAAVWGGHEGSLLLWLLMQTGWAYAVSRLSKQLPDAMVARVLGVLGLVTAGFLLFVLLTSNPFERLFPVPQDGWDLNPLLQDIGLIFHPPLLYMGYVGFSVAFAFAIAALLAGQLDSTWARWSRPWATAAWAFLTVGIALGSWWAYYELGWGGWWFWDPVENSSFIPWLVGTALIHSLAVTEKRASFKNWTVLLSIGAFSCSLLGAFLVRSGVLTSVHAFATDPRRGLFILILLTVIVGTSLALFAWRAPKVGMGGRFDTVSRESLLLANNVLLVVTAGAVALGTLYPLLIDALGLGKLSVGPPYFNAVFVPLMIPALLLIAVGPVANWKAAQFGAIFRQLRVPMIAAPVVGLTAPFVLGHWSGSAALGLMLATWIAVSVGTGIFGRMRATRGGLRAQPRSWLGMHMAHLGIAVFVTGVTIVSGYETERDVRLAQGESVSIGGYNLTLVGVRSARGPNYVTQIGDIELSRDGKVLRRLHPEKRNYPASQMPMTEVAIDANGLRHVYAALGEPLGEGVWSVRVYHKPFVDWIWIGCILMALGGGLAISDRRYRLKPRRQHAAQPLPEATS